MDEVSTKRFFLHHSFTGKNVVGVFVLTIGIDKADKKNIIPFCKSRRGEREKGKWKGLNEFERESDKRKL